MAKNNTLPGTIPDRLQPHNVEAEEAVLGALLENPDAILKVASFLAADDFYIERNGWIYEVVRTLHDQQKPPDIVLIADELERRGQLDEIGGSARLTALLNMMPTSLHAEYYGRIVERTSILRRLINGAGEIVRLAYEDTEDASEVMDRAEEIIFGVTQKQLGQRGLRPASQVVDQFFDRLEYLQEHQGEVIGLPTGLKDLDRLLGGLQRSDMIIMAGRPSMGKTSLALSIALQAARRHQKRTAIFSLEMSDEQLIQRLLSAETGISTQRLRTGDIKEGEWPALLQSGRLLSETKLFIDDTPSISVTELRAKARRLHAEAGLDLLIIDYLQLMRGGTRVENRQQEVSEISRAIKGLARELNIPILALSQLSRKCEERQDKRPMLSDLRESGCLTGDTLITLSNGKQVPIHKVQSGDRVLALNESTLKVEPAIVSNAFSTGVKPVYKMTTARGRSIRATGNHKFKTTAGWVHLDELQIGQRIATPHLSRERAAKVASIVKSDKLSTLVESDVYWDKIVSIEPDGEEEVFDLTIPGNHNFVANNIIAHNSLEQDSDVVLFIYRDEVYNPDTEFPNVAEIICAKHRQGPTGAFSVYFKKDLTQFVDLEVRQQPLVY